MVTIFLFTTLVIFSLNLIFNLVMFGIGMANEIVPYVVVINIVVNLIMVTLNIFALMAN